MPLFRSILICLACAAVLLLSGCTALPPTRHAVKLPDEFGTSDIFTRSFPGDEAHICEAARRALLSQGYLISEANAAFLRGRRKFQVDQDVHAEIEFNVVCAADSKGSNASSMFANAVRDRYSLKRTNSSASIGVSALGSLSLPVGSTDDALVKVGSETISTGNFYEQFFGLVERYLDPERLPEPAEPARDAGHAAASSAAQH